MVRVGEIKEIKGLLYHTVEVIPQFDFGNRKMWQLSVWMEDPKNKMPDGAHYKSPTFHLWMKQGQTLEQLFEGHADWYLSQTANIRELVRSLPRP